MSVDIRLVEEFLKSKNIKYVASCSFIEDEDTLILNIPNDFLSSGLTTSRKISNLKNSISKKFDTHVIDSVVQSEKSSSINSGITSVINEIIPSSDYDLSLIIQSAGDFSIFVKFKKVINTDKISKIKENLEKYFEILSVKKFNIEFIKVSNNPPTLPAILRSAKKIAPFLLKEIIAELESRSFELPSEKWMNTQLDSIRKRGFIFRRQDGLYALTYRGILVTPVTKNRNSSDVERVLYLASKKW